MTLIETIGKGSKMDIWEKREIPNPSNKIMKEQRQIKTNTTDSNSYNHSNTCTHICVYIGLYNCLHTVHLLCNMYAT